MINLSTALAGEGGRAAGEAREYSFDDTHLHPSSGFAPAARGVVDFSSPNESMKGVP
jgi:hypothetical protein